MKKCLIPLMLGAAVLLAACAKPNPNVYSAGEVGEAARVVPGVIVSKRLVEINGNTGIGAGVGAAGGAVAGATIGASSAAHIGGGIGGALVGGLVGNVIDKAAHSGKGYEYIIKLKHGGTISVVQAPSVELAVGEPVLMIYGATTRIIPDTRVPVRHARRHHKRRHA